jgi:hypothetical protein
VLGRSATKKDRRTKNNVRNDEQQGLQLVMCVTRTNELPISAAAIHHKALRRNVLVHLS